jgi:arylsulfatase A-like enzyme
MIDPVPLLSLELYVSSLAAAAVAALLGTVVLGCKALWDFSRPGPRLPDEVVRRYRGYAAYAFLRLCAWWFLVQWILASMGVGLYVSGLIIVDGSYHSWWALAFALGSMVVLVFVRFCQILLFAPSSIIMSFHYHSFRLYGLWQVLSPARLRWIQWGLRVLAAAILVMAAVRLATIAEWGALTLLVGTAGLLIAALVWDGWLPEPKPKRATATKSDDERGARPNVVMIGCDTLRVDRLGAMGYRRRLTPSIDSLVEQGALFSNCYTPLARTAPSLASLLTGRWPHHHGVRSNFVGDADTHLDGDTLPRLLEAQGYRTEAIADWGGADLGKLDFGFQQVEVPPDQWNLKYYLRQGPMDLRLMLSLFSHGRFGKRFLPELYYLPGTPLTTDMGRDARTAISRFAQQGEPFFLNLFMATAHVPFGSEYPYYFKYSGRDYRGSSKFSMSHLATPGDIVEQQESPASKFDVPQIINLYDACVSRFDDEVGRIVRHLQRCGLADNTIVVVYSDHGSDFFEEGSWGQGNTFSTSDPSARIPLVIADPRSNGPAAPVADTTRSVDLMPTLLDLLGISVPTEIDGCSLAPYVRGSGERLQLAAFQETGVWLGRIPGMDDEHLTYPNILNLLEIREYQSGTLSLKRDLLPTIVQAKDRMIREGRWKLIYQPMTDGARYRLYDLESDDGGTEDVAAQHPQVVEDLRQRLIAWMREDPSMCWDGTYMVACGDASSAD